MENLRSVFMQEISCRSKISNDNLTLDLCMQWTNHGHDYIKDRRKK